MSCDWCVHVVLCCVVLCCVVLYTGSDDAGMSRNVVLTGMQYFWGYKIVSQIMDDGGEMNK
jgi:hypothetical protein